MQFTGKNLELLSEALEYAISGINLEIGVHPDPVNYEDEIDELEETRERIKKMKARIDRGLNDDLDQ